MFGCIGRLGCLAVLLLIAAGAWLTRDRWYPALTGRDDRATVVDASWEPVTPEAAAAGRRKVERLGERGGPALVALEPAEVAGVVLEGALRQLPSAAQGASASVVGDRVYVRAVLRLRDLGGDVLGPFAGMLGQRDTLLLGGPLEIVGPELAQFRVAEVRVRDFSLPPAVIPRLLRQLRRGGALPAGVAADALPIPVPPQVAEVRVARGRVTLYREARP
jgi:hypothetical protein